MRQSMFSRWLYNYNGELVGVSLGKDFYDEFERGIGGILELFHCNEKIDTLYTFKSIGIKPVMLSVNCNANEAQLVLNREYKERLKKLKVKSFPLLYHSITPVASYILLANTFEMKRWLMSNLKQNALYVQECWRQSNMSEYGGNNGVKQDIRCMWGKDDFLIASNDLAGTYNIVELCKAFERKDIALGFTSLNECTKKEFSADNKIIRRGAGECFTIVIKSKCNREGYVIE